MKYTVAAVFLAVGVNARWLNMTASSDIYKRDTSNSFSQLQKRDGPGVVNAAVSQEGLPYVWGGGGCNGPSGGGFDCSGLTQYAVCQAQAGKTIPRTAQTQYHSDMGTHLPRAEAQPGDMLFWGENGDCDNHVVHVGIFMSPGKMVNAATTGTPVREQNIWESSGGESICPDAVRFW